MKKKTSHNRIPADPANWSEKSQGSVGAYFIKEYEDKHYTCYKCKQNSIFTAREQKYTYEVKKAPIEQDRVLCTNCLKESHILKHKITECEARWKEARSTLEADYTFLTYWLGLLTAHAEYIRIPNTAAINMLNKRIRNMSDKTPKP